MTLSVCFAMRSHLPTRLFDERALADIRSAARIETPVLDTAADSAPPSADLADVDVLITSWGAPVLDEPMLLRMPALRAVLHAAGSVRGHVTDAVFQRGILVSTAAEANAGPVAEYTLAMILLSAKGVFRAQSSYREHRVPINPVTEYPDVGANRRRVGIVGASRIGRRVIRLLRPFDFVVSVYDPYLSDAEARRLGVERVDLDDLLRHSEIISLHAPALPETTRLIDRRRLALVPDGATVINTARGVLVDTAALTAELRSGRISAVLDVTDPEVLPASDPLYDLPNVILTPHMAGALGNELFRLGRSAADELLRFAAGRPLAQAVTPADLARSA